MKKIPLSQGKVALVDDKDFPSLNLFKWYAKESWKKGSDKWYAVRCVQVNNHAIRGCKCKRPRKRKTIRMHNVIMQPGKDEITHHKDGNGLDNQRYNLENVSELENQQQAAAKTNGKKQEQRREDEDLKVEEYTCSNCRWFDPKNDLFAGCDDPEGKLCDSYLAINAFNNDDDIPF